MKRRKPPPPGQSVNITSLCDIMLSLLIFFMLVSKAGIDTGADDELALPVATLGITEEQFEEERATSNSIVLNVSSSTIPGNPRVYGKLMTTGVEFEYNVVNPQTDREEVRLFLEELRGENEQFDVFLHGASNLPYFDAEPVLRAISRSGATQVQYAIEQPQ
jgi:biopolymer transport protein ExbD